MRAHIVYYLFILFVFPASTVSPGRVRGYRDDGSERAVRAEVQLPPPHVPRHGLPLGNGRTQICIYVSIIFFLCNEY